MMYQGLFKSRYPSLHGKDWIRNISTEDLQVFIDIGQSASDHGRLGGKSLVKKRGKKYMKEIARRGALVTNMKKYFARAILEEQEKING